jgi:putative acetyltransferase
MVTIREETPADAVPIAVLNRVAFGGPYEAEVVDALRAASLVIASLVAEEAGAILGHIMFSRLPVETEAGTAIPAVALGPMAVHPERQRQGIGTALINAGLDACRARGESLVIVLGHPTYYPRFGFSAALAARTLRAPFSGEAFMALELKPGILDGVCGTVHYPRAWGELG